MPVHKIPPDFPPPLLQEDLPLDGGTMTSIYSRSACAAMKVPCRFVSDHPCCRHRMHLDLVARVRAMDGSADLRWRASSEEEEEKEEYPPKFKGPRAKARQKPLEEKRLNAM